MPSFHLQDLDLEALDHVLQSLSDHFIPKRRLKLRETVVGVGGFGTVKLAELWSGSWMKFLGRPTIVVVKELQTERFKGMELRIAFRLAREMRVWASCKHDNILAFTGYHLTKDFRYAYLISPYMKNGNIKHYLKKETPSLERRLALVFDTIKGLSYLHSKIPPIVHGDLKALNVLVNDHGEALLSDFGLAKVMEDKSAGLSTSNGFQGTIRYCSPEVLQGSPRDWTSDIWAWGCLASEMNPIRYENSCRFMTKEMIMWQIVTDNLPYHELKNEPQIVLLICGQEEFRKTPEPADTSRMPPRLLILLRKCWTFEPNQRPSSGKCLDTLELINSLYTDTLEPVHVDLPEHLFISRTRIRLSTPRMHPVSPANDGDVIELLPHAQSREVIRVRMKEVWVNDPNHLTDLATTINQLSSLQHANLLGFLGYSLNQHPSIIYVLSPFMHNGNVLDYLSRNKLESEAKVKLLQDILEGLQYLHSPTLDVVHGTLNPWTVLVNDEGKAVLSDISIDLQQTKRDMLNPRRLYIFWCSPEVVQNYEITGKSDIWSWACIVLQVMCGQRPYDGAPTVHAPSEAISKELVLARTPEPYPEPHLPRQLLELLRNCWKNDPKERPSARDCGDSILTFVTHEEFGRDMALIYP